MGADEVKRRMTSLAAVTEYKARLKRRRKKRSGLLGRVPEVALRLAGVVFLCLSGALYWWLATPVVPQPVVLPKGVQLSGLAEVHREGERDKEKGWFVEGAICNDTDSPVTDVRFSLIYKDSSGTVVALFVPQAKDLKARESRPFRVPFPAYSPELKRDLTALSIN